MISVAYSWAGGFFTLANIPFLPSLVQTHLNEEIVDSPKNDGDDDGDGDDDDDDKQKDKTT